MRTEELKRLNGSKLLKDISQTVHFGNPILPKGKNMNTSSNGVTLLERSIPRSIFISSSALLCAVGNTLILLSLKRYPNLRTPANLTFGSLAFSDLLVTCPLIIRAYSPATGRYSGLHSDIQNWLSTILLAIASLHISCISVDRYIAIKCALRYHSLVTVEKVLAALIVNWSSSVIIVGVVPLVTSITASSPEQFNGVMLYYKTKDELESNALPIWLVICKVLVFFGYFFIPFLVMVVSYSYIMKVALAKRKAIRVQQQTFKQVKSTKTLCIVVAVFFLLNSPYSITNLVILFVSSQEIYVMSQYLLILASLSSCVNPFIYAYREKHFKRAFKKILGLQK